jgi:hypothetical protein
MGGATSKFGNLRGCLLKFDSLGNLLQTIYYPNTYSLGVRNFGDGHALMYGYNIPVIGNGGRGIVSSISGIPIEYGSGGSGNRWNLTFSDINGIATGGGGYQDLKDINNKTYIYNVYNGVPGSGGGGHPLSW